MDIFIHSFISEHAYSKPVHFNSFASPSCHCCFWHDVKCTSVETGQLFHQYCRPLVVTAEVLERCKVQRGRVWWRLGDPSHVSLLMLSHGEVDTQPTGVTVPPPKPLSHHENGAEASFGLLFTSISFVSVVC